MPDFTLGPRQPTWAMQDLSLTLVDFTFETDAYGTLSLVESLKNTNQPVPTDYRGLQVAAITLGRKLMLKCNHVLIIPDYAENE